MSDHARMLGPVRQPPCGKHCGYHDKRTASVYKRAAKRADRQKLRAEIAAGQR